MPRPSLGRVQLRIRVTPECKAALGQRPSERARELLEAWAANASSDVDESAPLEEGTAAKPSPGRRSRGHC